MKTIRLGNSAIEASEIALGCMRICRKTVDEAERLVLTALEQGINYFCLLYTSRCV